MCLLSSCDATYQIKDFHTVWPWNYKSDGLYEVDIGIANSGTDSAGTTLSDGSIVMAIGDLDDDKHNDILTMSDDQKTLTVNYYSDKTMDYSDSQVILTDGCKISAVYIIPNPTYRIALLCSEESG